MSDDPEDPRMKALEARISAAKGTQAPKPAHQEEHYSQANVAWRMVTELVAGLGIGFGIGYGLDWLFGTRPFLMVLFILLGFAAGVKTMMRTAAEIQRKRPEELAVKTASPGTVATDRPGTGATDRPGTGAKDRPGTGATENARGTGAANGTPGRGG